MAVARTKAGNNAVLYRVSSRAFPSRKVVERNGALVVMPSEGHEGDLREAHTSCTTH